MERRGFLKFLGATGTLIMLPSLASEVVKDVAAPALPAIPATAAELTAWMQGSFKVFAAAPAAFMEVKAEELPKMYGFGIDDIPAERFAYNTDTGAVGSVRFNHFVMAFGTEGDDPVEAERRLVEAMHYELNKLEANLPLFMRVEPQFRTEQVTEFGDTWMTWEQVQDRTDLLEELERVKDGRIIKYTRRLPDAPLTPPEGVELDIETGAYKYVKRKYTLNKLRMRMSLPTASLEIEDALATPEGGRTKRI